MIYCVEDDRNIRELIVYTLNASGFAGRGFESGEELLIALGDETPELITLDIMLPGEDGIAILKRLRADRKSAGVPVILVTAKSAEYDKVQGLDLGADDYITKPFGMMEFISRVRAVLRRSKADEKEKDVLKFGELVMDRHRHRVYAGEREVPLTFKEYELLSYLMTNAGIVLTRDQILDKVWGYSFDVETRTVDVHVRTLRQKLGSSGSLIQTVRGVGYTIDA